MTSFSEIINSVDNSDDAAFEMINRELNSYFDYGIQKDPNSEIFITELRDNLIKNFKEDRDYSGEILLKVYSQGFSWFRMFIETPQDQDQLYALITEIIIYCNSNIGIIDENIDFNHKLILRIFNSMMAIDSLFTHSILSRYFHSKDDELNMMLIFPLLEILVKARIINERDFIVEFIKNKNRRPELSGYKHYKFIQKIFINYIDEDILNIAIGSNDYPGLLAEDPELMKYMCKFLVENIFEIDNSYEISRILTLYFFIKNSIHSSLKGLESSTDSDNSEIKRLNTIMENIKYFRNFYINNSNFAFLSTYITQELLDDDHSGHADLLVPEMELEDAILFIRNYPREDIFLIDEEIQFINILISKIHIETLNYLSYSEIFNKFYEARTYSPTDDKENITTNLKNAFLDLLIRELQNTNFNLNDLVKILQHIGFDIILEATKYPYISNFLDIIINSIDLYIENLQNKQISKEIKSSIIKLTTEISLFVNEREKIVANQPDIPVFSISSFQRSNQKLGVNIIKRFIEIYNKLEMKES